MGMPMASSANMDLEPVDKASADSSLSSIYQDTAIIYVAKAKASAENSGSPTDEPDSQDLQSLDTADVKDPVGQHEPAVSWD